MAKRLSALHCDANRPGHANRLGDVNRLGDANRPADEESVETKLAHRQHSATSSDH